MNTNSPIGWCDATWNPVTGCLNNCPYCYARKLAEGRLNGRCGYNNGFQPTFHPTRLQEPYKLRKPTKIFVSSMGDLFGDWVPKHWVDEVFEVVYANPRHTFQFLTKYPQNVQKMLSYPLHGVLPDNAWIGTTVTTQHDMWRIDHVRKLSGGARFVSFEPLLENIQCPRLEGISWIIIGAETGKRPARVSPDSTWAQYLTTDADEYGCAVYMKDNLIPHMPDGYKLRKEFPVV